MKRYVLFASAGLVLVAALAVPVISGEKGGKGHEHGYLGHGSDEAAMEARKQAAQPGEFHDHLEPLAGKWSLAVKWRKSPDAAWTESTSTAVNEWIMGHRFLKRNVKGDTVREGQEDRFEGMGIFGYDNRKGKYTSAWIDNRRTGIMTSLGECDASGKTFTMEREYTSAATGQVKKVRKVLRIINNNKFVSEVYKVGPDGVEFMAMQITNTRS